MKVCIFFGMVFLISSLFIDNEIKQASCIVVANVWIAAYTITKNQKK